MEEQKQITWSTFLKDVFICSLGAYGGPEAHYGVFTDQMVTKKNYLTEEELVELIALTGILPGPSSTQTIVAIGYKVWWTDVGISNYAGMGFTCTYCNDDTFISKSIFS